MLFVCLPSLVTPQVDPEVSEPESSSSESVMAESGSGSEPEVDFGQEPQEETALAPELKNTVVQDDGVRDADGMTLWSHKIFGTLHRAKVDEAVERLRCGVAKDRCDPLSEWNGAWPGLTCLRCFR